MICYDLPAEEYFASGSIGITDAQKICDVGAERWMVERDRGSTAAQAFGTAVHSAVLEGAEIEGLTPAKMRDAEGIRDAVLASEPAMALLGRCKLREVSLFETYNGETVRARIDAMDDRGDLIIDLKTTTDSSPARFPDSIKRFGYMLQAAWYCRMVKNSCAGEALEYYIIAAEKAAPYPVEVYRLGIEAEHLEEAERVIDRATALLESHRAEKAFGSSEVKVWSQDGKLDISATVAVRSMCAGSKDAEEKR